MACTASFARQRNTITLTTARKTEISDLIRILSFRNTADSTRTTAEATLVVTEAATTVVVGRPYSRNTVKRAALNKACAPMAVQSRSGMFSKSVLSTKSDNRNSDTTAISNVSRVNVQIGILSTASLAIG